MGGDKKKNVFPGMLNKQNRSYCDWKVQNSEIDDHVPAKRKKIDL